VSFQRSLNNLREISGVAKDIILKNYPSFIYGEPLSRQEIPVFCFHSAEPHRFENILKFLEKNAYKTLTTDEFYNLLIGNDPPVKEKQILLTFDDGMGSVWSVAYPLLKKYGFKATVFLIPGRIKEGEAINLNLEDVWSGKASLEEVEGRDQSHEWLATWKEIGVMHNSGIVDFQSHTLHHSLIFTSGNIVDFVSPQAFAQFHPFEFPLTEERACSDDHGAPKLGTPLYSSTPRMASALRYFDDEELREGCIRYVEENGGEAFFKDKEWRRGLRCFMGDYEKNHGQKGWYETIKEQELAMLHDLKKSKEMIESRLPGKVVQHLCYPWGEGSDLSIHLSEKAGYKTNFWGKVDSKLVNKPGQDPYKVSRMGEDFLWLLHGKGRESLIDILLTKVKRRFYAGSPYLSH